MRTQAVVLALLAGGIALPAQPAAWAAPDAPAVAPATAGAARTTATAAATTARAPSAAIHVTTPAATPAELARGNRRVGGTTVADADDGLDAQAKTTFVVDPAACTTHASTEATLTNRVPDRDRGSFVEQYYFYRYAIPVLAEAANLRAVNSSGAALTVSVEASEDAAQQWVKFAVVDLQPHLLSGQTQTIRLDYELPCQPPRAAGLSRANDALVMFPAFTPGDRGKASIEVRLPDSFTVEVVGDALDRQQRDGQIVLSASGIADPDIFTAIVVATDDDKLVSKKIEVDGSEVDVRAWPDDAEWATFVADQLGGIMPTLTDLVGQPWPTKRGLEVVETASPYAHGYAGWYSQTDHSISLGDELDPLVIAHELSHVWFNADLFDARWINEGLADEYAQTTLEQLHQQHPDAAAPDRSGPGAVALDDWSTPSLLDQQNDATETYGYAASWWVMDQIAGEIGVGKMREVVDAVANHEIAYAGDGKPETVAGVANWHRLLDELENVGGSKRASELFATFVANDSEKPPLVARTAARLQYAGLVDRGGKWAPPLAVRQMMSQWRFDEMADAAAQTGAILDVRDATTKALRGHEIGHLGLEDSYESADDLGDLRTLADDTLDAARAYGAADERYDDGPGIVGTVGLLGTGTKGRLDDAADELAGGDPAASLDASAAVQGDLDSATRNGLLRLAGALVVAGALWVAFGSIGSQRRRHRAEQAEQGEVHEIEGRYAALPPSPPYLRHPSGDDRTAWPRSGRGASDGDRAGPAGSEPVTPSPGLRPFRDTVSPVGASPADATVAEPFAPTPDVGIKDAPEGVPRIRIDPEGDL